MRALRLVISSRVDTSFILMLIKVFWVVVVVLLLLLSLFLCLMTKFEPLGDNGFNYFVYRVEFKFSSFWFVGESSILLILIVFIGVIRSSPLVSP